MHDKKIIRMTWVFLVFLAGCYSASAPVTYYTLQSGVTRTLPEADRSAEKLSIGIGPLTIPDYLDRGALVTRTTPHQVQIQEAHRWAGTLQDEVLRAISENIQVLTGARGVEALPWAADFNPDLRVGITIRAFEGTPGGKVNLLADWWIQPFGSTSQPLVKTTAIQEPVKANNMEALTAAMSRALAELSRQIAESILKIDYSAFISSSTATPKKRVLAVHAAITGGRTSPYPNEMQKLRNTQ